ncbi:hypothetical protein ACIQM4_17685 [Streptomyces sp. NPDC091272]|uniref:hypothetical protein n=1 Tax=Streptomyces sp. NPDC091272 TaxID=3365981 RepID=UPI0037FA922D
METVEAVSDTAGVPGGPGSAPRGAAVAPVGGTPGSASASHATAQHWPTTECSTTPEMSALPDDAPGAAWPGSEELGPEVFGPEPLDLVTVPARQGLEAVDILRRSSAACADATGPGSSAVGPVLHDGPCDTVGFLVPPGTADGWDMPGSACTQTLGRGVSFDLPPRPAGRNEGGGTEDGEGTATSATARTAPRPAPAHTDTTAPHIAEPPVTGTDWLLPPTTGTVPVTDPEALRRALGEAARLIEAADRCR